MKQTPVATAFLDASVLYPALLRNILMRMALHGLFRARWSSRINDEWTAALLRNRPDLTPEQVDRTRRLMDTHIQDAVVENFDQLIEGLTLPDPDDRHVLAAAIQCEARLIVTANLRDFPTAVLARFGIQAVHPDTFIPQVIATDGAAAVAAMQRLLAALRNPPMTSAELLAEMKRQGMNKSADALLDLIGAT